MNILSVRYGKVSLFTDPDTDDNLAAVQDSDIVALADQIAQCELLHML